MSIAQMTGEHGHPAGRVAGQGRLGERSGDHDDRRGKHGDGSCHRSFENTGSPNKGMTPGFKPTARRDLSQAGDPPAWFRFPSAMMEVSPA
jgi:hypothetical protein